MVVVVLAAAVFFAGAFVDAGVALATEALATVAGFLTTGVALAAPAFGAIFDSSGFLAPTAAVAPAYFAPVGLIPAAPNSLGNVSSLLPMTWYTWPTSMHGSIFISKTGASLANMSTTILSA